MSGKSSDLLLGTNKRVLAPVSAGAPPGPGIEEIHLLSALLCGIYQSAKKALTPHLSFLLHTGGDGLRSAM